MADNVVVQSGLPTVVDVTQLLVPQDFSCFQITADGIVKPVCVWIIDVGRADGDELILKDGCAVFPCPP